MSSPPTFYHEYATLYLYTDRAPHGSADKAGRAGYRTGWPGRLVE